MKQLRQRIDADELTPIEQELVDALERLFRSYQWVLRATALFIVLTVGGGVWAYVTITDLADNNRQSLCSLRKDVEQRRDGAEAFLVAHPDGVAGISRADIERSIAGYTSTVEALGGLDCG